MSPRIEICQRFSEQISDGGDERGMVVEAAHHDQVSIPRLTQRCEIRAEAHLGVVGRERQPDQPFDPGAARLSSSVGDERMRVLHAREHRQPEPSGQRPRLRAGDLRQRRAPDGVVSLAKLG